MTKIELINLAYAIFKKEITIHLQTKSGKWYDKKYTNDFIEIETNTIYGICVGGNMIDFDFKTGKKQDNILKSFVNQFISKYEVKQSIGFESGQMIYPKKVDIMAKLKNSNRVSKYFFYTTLYGIGWFCYFTNQKAFKEVNNGLASYLKNKGINFTNEFSDAGWVYRFVINKDVKLHNSLLTDFNI